MRYRAFWKGTWYESEDYGALCRCLSWVGAESFMCVLWAKPFVHPFRTVIDKTVVVYKCEHED